ncbi:MAG: hypothetical protein U9N14_07035, partial [Pseudomonadota bacterium]|nr:hypothetical protein [Pseudomonadota bacterium]
RLIETRTIFHSASRVGMQVALADPDNTDLIESAILSTLGEEADGATVTISENCACFDGSEIACDGSCSTGSVGRFITIQIDGSHDLLFDYPGVDDPTDIQIEATFRVQ